MKRSSSICLLVLGTAVALSGCTDNTRPELKQHRYASQADCATDWGDQQSCTRNSGAGGGYLGPRYFWNHSAGMPVAVMPDGSERTMSNGALAKGKASLAQGTSSVGKATSRAGGGSSIGSANVSRGGFGSSSARSVSSFSAGS